MIIAIMKNIIAKTISPEGVNSSDSCTVTCGGGGLVIAGGGFCITGSCSITSGYWFFGGSGDGSIGFGTAISFVGMINENVE